MDEIYLSDSDWETLAYARCAGERKTNRRSIRNQLGTSRDPAPTAADALRSAEQLSRMLVYATAGEYELVVRKRANGHTYGPLTLWRSLRDELKDRRRAALAQLRP